MGLTTGISVKTNRLTVSAILLSALFSCRSPQTLMILTDAPEMVAYAEIFNRQSSSCKAYVTYSPTPETELRLNTEMYDLVFASSILDKEFIDLFANLNSLVRNNRISGSQLYPHLLETYRNQGTRPVIPAAFDLHIFLTPKPNPVPDNRMISFKDLMDACKEFSVFRDGVYSKIAYSPIWSRNLFYHYLEEYDCAASAWGREDLNVDEEKLSALLNQFKTAYREAFPIENGNAEKTFRKKYLYDSYKNLLGSGRILFYDTEIGEWMKTDPNEDSPFDFLYFCESGKITTEPDVLFFAVPKAAKAPRKAEKFIRWFFEKETQELLIAESEKSWLNSFGIAGRLSSVVDTNETGLCRLYPYLTFRLPPAEMIYGSTPKPLGWERLTEQVLDPWVEQNLHSETPVPYPAGAVRLWFAEYRN